MKYKARRIGFSKVYGRYPRASSETIEYKTQNQRGCTETKTPINLDVLDGFERFMLRVIFEKLEPQLLNNYIIDNDDDFDVPF